MEIQEFIERFEEKAEIIKNSVTYKGTFRIIEENDWQNLKKKALAHYFVEDDIEYGGNEE